MSCSERSRSKILVADDERVIAETLVIILRQNGFDSTAVSDGKEAVERARIWRPDVFLSDVVMPQMSGIEAALQIRAMLPACRVLLFSGQAVTSDLLRDARAAGNDFEVISKPVHPQDLLDRLITL
jgi:CheY-like chemotaxis protein